VRDRRKILPRAAQKARPARPQRTITLEGVTGMIPTARNVLTRPPTGRYFHPSHPPIASQSISWDVPSAQARAFWVSPLRPRGSSQAALYCSHRTSTVLSCAFCEHKVWSGCSPSCSSQAAVARARGLSQLPCLLFQHPVKASQPDRSQAETRARRLSAHSALCSHRSTRQTTRFAPGRESAWLRSLALHSPRVCA